MNTLLEPVINMMNLAITMVFDRFPSEAKCRNNHFILYQICEAVANELGEKHFELFTTPFFEQFASLEDIHVDDNFGTVVEYKEKDIEVKNVLDSNRPYTDKMWDKYNYLYNIDK